MRLQNIGSILTKNIEPIFLQVAKYWVDFLVTKYLVKLLRKLQNIQFSVILNNTQLASFGNSIGGRKGNATDLQLYAHSIVI